MNVFCFNICNVFECLPPWPALYSFSESKPRPPPWSPVLTPAQLQFSVLWLRQIKAIGRQSPALASPPPPPPNIQPWPELRVTSNIWPPEPGPRPAHTLLCLCSAHPAIIATKHSFWLPETKLPPGLSTPSSLSTDTHTHHRAEIIPDTECCSSQPALSPSSSCCWQDSVVLGQPTS